jgi:hypothetical protein
LKQGGDFWSGWQPAARELPQRFSLLAETRPKRLED